jgi:hypothetical protein
MGAAGADLGVVILLPDWDSAVSAVAITSKRRRNGLVIGMLVKYWGERRIFQCSLLIITRIPIFTRCRCCLVLEGKFNIRRKHRRDSNTTNSHPSRPRQLPDAHSRERVW